LHSHSIKPNSIVTRVPDNTLYAVAVISNPVRYNSRYKLYREFADHVNSFEGVKLVTVECAFGDRNFEITEEGNPFHIQVRTQDELWIKENLINIGFSRLPSNSKYIAWVDADIQFVNKDWVAETVHQLQHYSIVQLFQNAIDLGPTGQSLEIHTGFGYQLVNGSLSYLTTIPGKNSKAKVEELMYYGGPSGSPVKGAYAHSGFAWAARKEAINAIGGLPSFCVVGSADHHFALSLIGKGELSIPGNIGDAYSQALMNYQDRCVKYIKRNVGYVEGTILHKFHGAKKNRKYVDRWKIITSNKFDPNKDIWYDTQGILQLNPEKIKLRDELRAYFRVRDEDNNSL
jgi:hypothetical protein